MSARVHKRIILYLASAYVQVLKYIENEENVESFNMTYISIN